MPRWDRPIKWIKNDDHTLSAQLDIDSIERRSQKSIDNNNEILSHNETNEQTQDAIHSDRKPEKPPKNDTNVNNNLKKSTMTNTTTSGTKRKREEADRQDQQMSKKPRIENDVNTNNNMEIVQNTDEDPTQKKKRNKRRKKKNPNVDQAATEIQEHEDEENNEENNNNDKEAEDKEYLIVDEDYAVDPNAEEELPTTKEGIKAFDLIQQAKKEENVMKYNKLISMVRIIYVHL